VEQEVTASRILSSASILGIMAEQLAAVEEVWLALIQGKEDTLDLNTANGVEELLALYELAEQDYLCAH
jgi:hypothetical protein